MFITSGGFVAWLSAKASVTVLSFSVDMAFIIAGMSGILGFSASISFIDKFISKNVK